MQTKKRTMPKQSDLPTLDLFEGIKKWGQIRLRPEFAPDNLIHVELREEGTEVWKPIYVLCAVAGKIAMQAKVGHSGRNLIYDPDTHSFADLTPRSEYKRP